MSPCRRIRLLYLVTLWLTFTGSVAASAGTTFPPAWRFSAGADPVASQGGMVVTADSLATGVGVEIMRTGGNAIDAAVAISFAMAVTFPEAGNLGGGGFLVLRLADGTAAALDFRETAPAAATRDMYLDQEGNPTDRSLYGALAAGVPGTVMGMWQVHQRFGSLPWPDLLAPAIGLAEEGFAIRPPHHDAFAYLASRLSYFDGEIASALAGTAETYLPGGAAPEIGALFLQPDLAATLRRIASNGSEGFYTGETAERLVEEMERDGGILTRDDLKGYRSVWREPVTFPYRGHTIVTMPPASSGGATMAEIANILSVYDLSALGWNSARRIHLLAEAAKRAYADRNRYLGDPSFVDVPLSDLISAEYAVERGKTIHLDAATPSTEVGPGLDPVDRDGETTHYSIVDSEGNAVSVTTTINTRFGSLVTVRGAGFLLNNEMDDFTSRPGLPNYY